MRSHTFYILLFDDCQCLFPALVPATVHADIQLMHASKLVRSQKSHIFQCNICLDPETKSKHENIAKHHSSGGYSLQIPNFDPRSNHIGFVMDKVAFG
jgi:hypothetical protein